MTTPATTARTIDRQLLDRILDTMPGLPGITTTEPRITSIHLDGGYRSIHIHVGSTTNPSDDYHRTRRIRTELERQFRTAAQEVAGDEFANDIRWDVMAVDFGQGDGLTITLARTVFADEINRIPVGVVPLSVDIKDWALAAGATTTEVIYAITWSVAGHIYGGNRVQRNAIVPHIDDDYRAYAQVYVDTRFSGHYDLWDGFTYDHLKPEHADQLLGHLVELATKEIGKSASGTANTPATTTKETNVIAMRSDATEARVVDDRPDIDFYWAPDEVAVIAAASAGTAWGVIDSVAWMAAADLIAGHHSLIPFHQVRDHIAAQLRGEARTYLADDYGKTWTWSSLVHDAVKAADDYLFQGRAYEYAERNGVATTRTRVGRIITERAALQIWPQATGPFQRVNPDSLRRYREIREAHDFVMSHALAYIEGHTGKAPARRDEGVFDLLDDATAKALLDRLAIIALPAS